LGNSPTHRRLVAGREKDLVFMRGAAKHGLADQRVLLARLSDTELPELLRSAVAARIARAFADPDG
jgi:hypothetical protein